MLTNNVSDLFARRQRFLNHRPRSPVDEHRYVSVGLHRALAYFGQEAQLMLTNPRDAFRGQSRSLKVVPLDRLCMVSY